MSTILTNKIETKSGGLTLDPGAGGSVTVLGSLAGTITTAAQPNITSVGTLSSLTVAGALNGTISTAAQPNITSLGTLSSLAVSGNLTVDNDVLFVDASSNNVGIGTSSPAQELSVSGKLGVGTTFNSTLAVATFNIATAVTTFTTASNYLQIGAGENAINSTRLIGFGYSITANTNQPAYIGYIETTNTGETKGDLIFGTRSVTTDTAPSERMRINSNGNVGIGTSVTTAKLQIENTNAGSSAVALFLNNESTSLNTETRLAFAASTNNDISSDRYSYISALNTSGSNGQALVFATNETGAAGTEKMRITSGGSVLIGTTSNTATTNAYFKAESFARNSLHLGVNVTTTATLARFLNPNGVVGSVSVSGLSTNFNTSGSDLRLKKNIEDWNETVLDNFATIEPKLFHFNQEEDTAEKTKGYIAQDMVDKFPEAYPQNDEGYYNYNPSGMVVYLMKAVKELTAEIETLKSQING